MPEWSGLGKLLMVGGAVLFALGLLFVAFVVLVAGVALLAMRNTQHSAVGSSPGGILKLVESR